MQMLEMEQWLSKMMDNGGEEDEYYFETLISKLFVTVSRGRKHLCLDFSVSYL